MSNHISQHSRIQRLRRAAIAFCIVLAGCSYSPPRWQHEIESGIPLPGTVFAAIAVKSESRRWPQGFVAQFPDGGSTILVEQRASIYIVDTVTRSQKLIATLQPGRQIRSGFAVGMMGWSTDGSDCYAELFGHSGATSDTPVVRQLFRIAVSGQGPAEEISSLPNDIVSPKNGEFDSKRRLAIWATDVSIQTWTPEGAPTTVLFRLDPVSGQLKPQ